MGKNTTIAWCHHTFSPWRGCAAVSEGCRHCYAETVARRFPKVHGTWGANGRRVAASERQWREVLKWNAEAEAAGVRKRVFCGSMCDVFENRLDLKEARNRLFSLIEVTHHLDWLLLTKHPENVYPRQAQDYSGKFYARWAQWPRNAWLGVSVENQEMADKRIPVLLELKIRWSIPVAFLSVEPMLERIRLRPIRNDGINNWDVLSGKATCNNTIFTEKWPTLDWVICGGESGANARPMETPWALALAEQCRSAGVPFFFKQMSQTGERRKTYRDFASFPKTLQKREFPNA